MAEARWFGRVTPGVVAIGAVLLIASTTTGARLPGWQPSECDGVARLGNGPVGAWYRLDPVILDDVRTGQRLTLGVAGVGGTRTLDLDPESFASGPFAGTVLVGSDDGASSAVSLLDVASGCAWAIHRSDEVVRHATITPDGTSLIEFRVDRRTRADRGVWRRPLAGPGPEVRILPPIDPDRWFGPTWLTELSWSDDGSLLMVESCGEVACRVRWLDLERGTGGSVADPAIGDVIGIDRARLVAHGACRGLPCPIRSVDLDGESVRTLVERAGQAVVARDADGRRSLVYEEDALGRAVGAIGLDGNAKRSWAGDPAGRRLIAGPGWSVGAAELPAGWVAFGPDGRLPLDGSVAPVLRRVDDGRSLPFDEVPR